MPASGTELDHMWIIICSALVLVMQVGFLCLEAGMTRTKNSVNVAMKNVVDFGLATLVFWAIGFGVLFGVSKQGVVGSSLFFFDSATAGQSLTVLFVFQLMFCGSAITIISGATAERMRFAGYLVIAVLVSGLLYPVFGHWVWNGSGTSSGWLKAIGFYDFAGSTVVHSVGGWISLAAILILGPRSGRFDDKASMKTIPANNLPMAMAGVLILGIGWLGFNGGSDMAFSSVVPTVIINTILGGGAGLLAAVVYGWIQDGYFKPDAMIIGPLAGLVSITASANSISQVDALVIGFVGSVLACASTSLLLKMRIDDVVGAIPVHLVGGVWGTLAVGLFSELDIIGTGLTRGEQIVMQLVGIGSCFVWSFGCSFVLLKVLNMFVKLRVSGEVERVGLNISEHKSTSEIIDLVNVMELQTHSQDMSIRATVEPFTCVGQIATHYNQMMDSLEKSVSKLADREAWINTVLKTAPDGLLTVDSSGIIHYVNPAVQILFGYEHEELVQMSVLNLFEKRDHERLIDSFKTLKPGIELKAKSKDNSVFDIALSAGSVDLESGHIVLSVHDISNRKRLQDQLAQAQKLEAVGQLAAGIAHEINTPVQYVGDNLDFINKSVDSIFEIMQMYSAFMDPSFDENSMEAQKREIQKMIDSSDLDFIIEEMPVAIQQTIDGTNRVSEIVRAMKNFSHPGSESKNYIDINEAIKSTLIVCRNRWKFVSEVETDFRDDLPSVPCHAGEINQVFLNILVNASDAIAETEVVTQGGLGKIKVTTLMVDDHVEVQIQDTGGGVPESIRKRIFEPFFTTKDVGEGTGQGLAISHDVIVNKHGGTLDLVVDDNQGSTFIICLPIDNQGSVDVDAAA